MLESTPLPHPVVGGSFTSPVAPGTGWPDDPADATTPIATSRADVERLAVTANPAELAARITEECFYSLEAPVLTVTGYDTPYPPSAVEHDYLPSLDRLLDAVDRTLGRRNSRTELDYASVMGAAR